MLLISIRIWVTLRDGSLVTILFVGLFFEYTITEGVEEAL